MIVALAILAFFAFCTLYCWDDLEALIAEQHELDLLDELWADEEEASVA